MARAGAVSWFETAPTVARGMSEATVGSGMNRLGRYVAIAVWGSAVFICDGFSPVHRCGCVCRNFEFPYDRTAERNKIEAETSIPNIENKHVPEYFHHV